MHCIQCKAKAHDLCAYTIQSCWAIWLFTCKTNTWDALNPEVNTHSVTKFCFHADTVKGNTSSLGQSVYSSALTMWYPQKVSPILWHVRNSSDCLTARFTKVKFGLTQERVVWLKNGWKLQCMPSLKSSQNINRPWRWERRREPTICICIIFWSNLSFGCAETMSARWDLTIF